VNQLLAELRRRNVFRVAAAYLVVGWMVMQIVSVMTPALELPSWVDGFFAVMLMAGLPVALLLAWAFEMTPEGMQKTAPADGDAKFRPLGITDFVLMGLMVLVLAVVGYQISQGGAAPVTQPIAQTPRGETTVSIAVLPFVDLSEAGDQEYFSDGISEEILNVLVRIPELGVAGRTSSFAFKNQNQDLRIIGEALGVNHVLEGSVRRSGERLRITAQLIRASDGFHIWSETYDRDLIDIFAIQDEIALAVSEQLAVSLGLSRESLSRSTTTNIEAYEAYLRARPLFFSRRDENLREAIVLLNHAIALDPEFAPAWGSLAGVYSVIEWYTSYETLEHVYQWRRAGRASAERAIALDPALAEGHVYLGRFQAVAREWEAAFVSLDRASELAPNDPAILDAIAQAYSEVGYDGQALEYSQQAVRIDPLVAIYRTILGYHTDRRRLEDTEESLAHWRAAIEIDPGFAIAHYARLRRLVADGRQVEARSALEMAHTTGAFSDGAYARYDQVLDAWEAGEDALRALVPDLHPFYAQLAGLMLDDHELVMDFWAEGLSTGRRSNLGLNMMYRGDFRNDHRWKAEVMNAGLLEFWHVRGFPTDCRAVGEDDFECDRSAPQ
jgi:TolB-like protein